MCWACRQGFLNTGQPSLGERWPHLSECSPWKWLHWFQDSQATSPTKFNKVLSNRRAFNEYTLPIDITFLLSVHTLSITSTTYLDGSWSECKKFIPSSFSVSIHVHQDIDSIRKDFVCCFAIAWNLWQVYAMFCFGINLGTESRSIIRTQGIAENLQWIKYI